MNAIQLNPELVKQQTLTDNEIAEIVRLHTIRESVFDTMDALAPTTDDHILAECVEIVEILEFKLQRAWRFKPDATMHTWWFRSPHCSCPEHENWKVFIGGGLEDRHVDTECVLHAN